MTSQQISLRSLGLRLSRSGSKLNVLLHTMVFGSHERASKPCSSGACGFKSYGSANWSLVRYKASTQRDSNNPLGRKRASNVIPQIVWHYNRNHQVIQEVCSSKNVKNLNSKPPMMTAPGSTIKGAWTFLCDLGTWSRKHWVSFRALKGVPINYIGDLEPGASKSGSCITL